MAARYTSSAGRLRMVCKEVRRTASGAVVVLTIYPEEASAQEGVTTQLVLTLENKWAEQVGAFSEGKRYSLILKDLPGVG